MYVDQEEIKMVFPSETEPKEAIKQFDKGDASQEF